MRISLIEDEPDCYEGLQELLSSRKHSVKVYEDADDVVDHMDEIAKSDVVVLDLMMQLGLKIKPSEAPETGIAIYKRLRKLNDRVRVIVMTARLKADVWSEFQADPNAYYIGKPVSLLDELYRMIEDPKP